MNINNELYNAESKIDKQDENQVQDADDRTYSYQDIANRFIVLFQEKKERLSHKKLQKLVYLSYGFCLYIIID